MAAVLGRASSSSSDQTLRPTWSARRRQVPARGDRAHSAKQPETRSCTHFNALTPPTKPLLLTQTGFTTLKMVYEATKLSYNPAPIINLIPQNN
jgi:hypothetical protein